MENRFKTLREKYKDPANPMKEIGQTELARMLDISRQTIIGLENEKSESIAFDVIKKYCDFFGVSADYLLGRSNAETTDEDIKMICRSTGLSETAVNALIEDNELGKENIFDLIARKNYAAVMNDLIEYDDKNVALFNYIYSFLHFDYMDVAESDLFWNDSDNRPDQMMKSLATVRLVDRNGVSCVVGLENAFYFTTQYITEKLNAIRLHIRAKEHPENSFEYHWNYEKKTRKQKGETK